MFFDKNLFILISVVAVGFPFFFPFGLFKSGKKMIDWLVVKTEEGSNGKLVIMGLYATCLGALLYVGTPPTLRLALVYPIYFMTSIMFINGMKNMSGE